MVNYAIKHHYSLKRWRTIANLMIYKEKDNCKIHRQAPSDKPVWGWFKLFAGPQVENSNAEIQRRKDTKLKPIWRGPWQRSPDSNTTWGTTPRLLPTDKNPLFQPWYRHDRVLWQNPDANIKPGKQNLRNSPRYNISACANIGGSNLQTQNIQRSHRRRLHA